MSDPIELELGISLDKIDEDSRAAARILQNNLNQPNAGGSAAQQQAASNPVSRMAAVMPQLLQSLTQMNQSLGAATKQWQQLLTVTQQQQQAAQAAAAAAQQAPGAGGFAPGTPTGKPPTTAGSAGGSSAMTHARGHLIVNAMRQVEQMMTHGFSEASVLRGIGGMLATAGPWGMGASVALSTMAAGRELEVGEGRTRLDLYRRGGNPARQLYHEMTAAAMAGSETFGWKKGSAQDLGLTNPEVARVVQGLMHAQGNTNNVWDVAKLQAGYGAGGEVTGFLGALTQQGQAGGRAEIAQVIGLFLAQGLDRGRFGQSFEFMTRAVASAVTGVVDVSELAKTAQFIGSAGDRYKGDSPSAHSMYGALEQMASGRGGGAAKYFSLRAAGLGAGKDYWEASLAASRGLDKVGGLKTRDVVGAYIREMPDIETAWRSGQRAYAANLLAMLSGQTPAMAEDMLQAYFSGGGAADVTAGREAHINAVVDQARVPDADRAHVDDENRKQYLLNRQAFYEGQSRSAYDSRGGDLLEKGAHYIESTEQFEALYGKSNYGQVRSNTVVDGKYQPGSRVHSAQDMFFPPGTIVHVAVAGTVVSVSRSMKDSRYGWTVEIEGDDGRVYKYSHLEERPPCEPGHKLPAGTPLGRTMRSAFPGGTKSHLDLSVRDKKGRSVNPYHALGLKGLNTLLSGDTYASQRGPAGPGGSPGGAAYDHMTRGASADDIEQDLESAERLTGARGGRSGGVKLDVNVYDHRVTVTQRANEESPSTGVVTARSAP